MCRERVSNFALLYLFFALSSHSASMKRGTVFEPAHLLIYSDSGEEKNEEKGREATGYSKSFFPCFPAGTFHSVETYNSLLRTDGIFVESRGKARGEGGR